MAKGRIEGDGVEAIDEALERMAKARIPMHRDLSLLQVKGVTGRMGVGKGGGGEGLDTRTGNLRGSFLQSEITVEGDGGDEKVTSFSGSDSDYAAIQNDGGRIEPTKAKSLAIPVDEALTEKGVHRYSSPAARLTQLENEGELGIFPVKGSPNITGIAGELDENDDLQVEYLFADYVDIHSTGYIDKGLDDVEPEMFELFAGEMTGAFAPPGAPS